MGQASVKISANGVGRGQVIVDGTDITHGISAVKVKIQGGEPSEVSLSLTVPRIEALDLTGATVVVDGVTMPASVEMALYKHLVAKHGPLEIDVTHLGCESRKFALKSA